jgi:CubicO group peptidase (beta-lactamase class C family)
VLRSLDAPEAPGGAVLVIREGNVVYKKAVGLANLEERVPNSTATNFRIASVTKPFTAMAVMMLVEDGKLSYESRLTDVFPEFPAYGKEITVRHLLTHTSGLADYADIMPRSTVKQLKDRDVLRLLANQKETAFPPGTDYRYSNSGYALLALMVERRSGQRFADFLRERMFAPLGMKNTLAYEEGGPAVPNRAFGYSPRTAGFQRTDQSLTSAVLGDGGIYTSVEDLSHWDQALEAAKLVQAETLERAFTRARLQEGRQVDYGFGWKLSSYRGLRCVGHGGSTVGFRSDLERFPDKKLTVIVLCNRSDARVQEMVRQIVDVYWDER